MVEGILQVSGGNVNLTLVARKVDATQHPGSCKIQFAGPPAIHHYPQTAILLAHTFSSGGLSVILTYLDQSALQKPARTANKCEAPKI